MNLNQVFEESEVVFLGKLVDLREIETRVEVASFQVEETYKGVGASELTVQNDFRSTCGSSFMSELFSDGSSKPSSGDRYYVFGRVDPSSGHMLIEGHKTFIRASEADFWGLGLPSHDWGREH